MSEIIAYAVEPNPAPLVPASAARDWMDRTRDRHAWRCLPLTMANAAGWVMLNPASIVVEWNGGERPDDVRIGRWSQESASSYSINASGAAIIVGAASPAVVKPPADTTPIDFAMAHFGSGIVTFRVSYLFRTPPGVNLWVKGPPNWPRDGIAPLEGIVETDWSPATFTMNWKFTRPCRVLFQKGEPLCHIHPVPRNYLESFSGTMRRIIDVPEEQARFQKWLDARADFIARLNSFESEAVRERWQKDYFHGQECDTHQTKLTVQPFKDERGVGVP
jgi:hypothetical protein